MLVKSCAERNDGSKSTLVKPLEISFKLTDQQMLNDQTCVFYNHGTLNWEALPRNPTVNSVTKEITCYSDHLSAFSAVLARPEVYSGSTHNYYWFSLLIIIQAFL